ncbi:helix-turn-helix domain-containing protein [Phytoactinopolyspora halophila]|uniref:helix-turn-helix domain-containing protein n=1 Tax=Phytoactinopolyspora halophila TaxID=1981511 RepID=UPI001314106C|nr:helix-turn-helix domain-containing protein [Phytoactinopolyspora halophila]
MDQPHTSIRRWPGMRSEYNWLPPDDSVTVTKPFQIGVSFSSHDQLEFELDGRARYLSVPSGAVFATGTQQALWADVSEHTEALEIYPDLDLVRDAVDPGATALVDLDPAIAVRDATVLGLASLVRRSHLHDDGDLEPMHASTLTQRLVHHLAEHYCLPRARRTTRSGRLDRTLVDRLAAFVDDRLAEPLTLDELAAQAALSVYHFARAFKNSTGLAPHEFVTMRRMERAKILLLATRHSVLDIAHMVGFSNINHFRRLFRRYTGFAPSDLRPR